MRRIVVCGGRDFNDDALMDDVLTDLIEDDDIVLCGLANGADTKSLIWCEDHDIKVEEYPARWLKYGKSAGIKRNIEMIDTATHLIAFWDGKSRGTKQAIEYAKKKCLKVKVIRYDS